MKKNDLEDLTKEYLLLRARGYSHAEIVAILKLKPSQLTSYEKFITEHYLEQQYDVKYALYQNLLERKKELYDHRLKPDGEPNLKVYDALNKLDKQLEFYMTLFEKKDDVEQEPLKVIIQTPDAYN